MWQLENTYRESLPSKFYSEQAPVPVANPEMVCFNRSLAQSLDLSKDLSDSEFVKSILSGKSVLAGTHPIAQAYAGHQFGQFTMLGDGRAVLLGEYVVNGHRYDIQLKGSGVTAYSRRGDGRATLSAMLREYLMSEALFHLGIKTTRSLAVAKTGEPVYREQANDGAVLTRIAQSHIRVGTFEYARFYTEQLEVFTKYAIHRHDPDLLNKDHYILAFVGAVMDRQIDLIVNWMRVGFIHGVMNTDNMSIAGETIDYGPCAFMNVYHPQTVFSSIDRQARYAYGNQPHIAHWNLSILANALLPLVNKDQNKAVAQSEELLQTFPEAYNKRYTAMMYKKLGIVHPDEIDRLLINDLLRLLEVNQVDYTNFFVSLRYQSIDDQLLNDDQFSAWFLRWQEAHERSGDGPLGLKLMDEHNPVVIPRNHVVEEVLAEATTGNMNPFNDFLQKLTNPYAKQDTQYVPEGYDQRYQTFCGT